VYNSRYTQSTIYKCLSENNICFQFCIPRKIFSHTPGASRTPGLRPVVENVGALLFPNPMGLHDLVKGYLCFLLIFILDRICIDILYYIKV
jgi:hypothetical protein